MLMPLTRRYDDEQPGALQVSRVKSFGNVAGFDWNGAGRQLNAATADASCHAAPE
jgi:hypothetical protein